MPANNQRLKQPGRASLRGLPKVIPKLKKPWLRVTEVAQILALEKVNSGAPLCAKRESGLWGEVFAELAAYFLNNKRTTEFGAEK